MHIVKTTQLIVRFNRVSLMVCELYHRKAVIFFKCPLCRQTPFILKQSYKKNVENGIGGRISFHLLISHSPTPSFHLSICKGTKGLTQGLNGLKEWR